jgi:Na+/H+ antiporter NhaB
MLTVTTFLLVAAFITTIAAAMGKAPLWIGVILAVLALMLIVLPK